MKDEYIKIGHVGERNEDGTFSGGIDLFIRAEDSGKEYAENVIRNAGNAFAEMFRRESSCGEYIIH